MRVGKMLTVSNVISCLALFVALGGSVYAAGKINGRQIKPNSLPGNRVKAKTLPGNRVKPGTLTARQVKPNSLNGSRIRAGSLTGTQIKAGSLTGTQIDTSTLNELTASKLANIQYTTSVVGLEAEEASTTATCPAGTNVVGGGASLTNPELALVSDSGPNLTRNGWSATGFGFESSMIVTAICVAAQEVNG